MQSRVFDPNERIALELPAHMINVLMEQLQKSVPVVPYIVYQPLMLELQVQLQQQAQVAQQPQPVQSAEAPLPRGNSRRGGNRQPEYEDSAIGSDA